ncbi:MULTISPECIES: hypothetical protein [unclassified Streptomyces]|uniref:hypothetical protein n=1 Tax=unclassified Streptomyces TaxID=2593676 RepID=UPI0033A1FEA9
MTPTHAATGRGRHAFAPATEESVRQIAPPPPPAPDPPIYRALLRTWADRGRTLPGLHDPEWIRLATPPPGPYRISAGRDRDRDPRGDTR